MLPWWPALKTLLPRKSNNDFIQAGYFLISLVQFLLQTFDFLQMILTQICVRHRVLKFSKIMFSPLFLWIIQHFVRLQPPLLWFYATRRIMSHLTNTKNTRYSSTELKKYPLLRSPKGVLGAGRSDIYLIVRRET